MADELLTANAEQTITAKYLIQVSLTHRRGKHILGGIHLFKKGSSFGRRDRMLYLCPTPKCKGFFHDTFELTPKELEEIATTLSKDPEDTRYKDWPLTAQMRYVNWEEQLVLCDVCCKQSIRGELPDSYGFHTTGPAAAGIVADFWRHLKCDADVYMVHTWEEGALQKAKNEFNRSKHVPTYERSLDKARNREMVFYQLRNILRDTQAGASVDRRFQALLEA